MGQHINIPTSRTQCIGGYLAQPQGKPKGGIVVIQEIFGVTAHIRHVADAVRGMKPRPVPERPAAMRLAGLEPFELV